MTLRVNLRCSDTTLAVSGRSAKELLATLGALGRRLDEQTLSSWLEDLERQGLAQRGASGRWTLTDAAMTAFGRNLSLLDAPPRQSEID